MDLKKSGASKEKSRRQDSGLFGIIDGVTLKDHMDNIKASLPVPLSYQARRIAVATMLEAEYRKAQAMITIRRMSIR